MHSKAWKAIWQYKWLYFWILASCVFGVVIYFWQGPSQAVDYFSGYLIELSLSEDNLFVFLLIFIVLLVGALSFFPALALGPIAEFFRSLV